MEFIIEDSQPVLLQLNDQRQTGTNCDIALCSRSSGKLFKCHKNILTARCDYFERMFESGLEESKKDVIEMGFEDSTIEAILQYIYTGKVNVSLDNAPEIVYAFNMMLLKKVVDKIDEHLATLVPHHLTEVIAVLNEFIYLEKSIDSIVQELISSDSPRRSVLFKRGNVNTIVQILKNVGDKCDVIFSDFYEWFEDKSSEVKASVYNNLDIQFLTPVNLKKLCDLEAKQSNENYVSLLLTKVAKAIINPFPYEGAGGFEFKCAGVSKLTASYNFSDTCIIGRIFWKLSCQKICKDGQEFLSIYLHGDGNPSAIRFRSEVKFTIQLLSSNRKSQTSKTANHVFQNKQGWGWEQFIAWDQLLNVENGYLVNDSITVEVQLSVQSEIKWT